MLPWSPPRKHITLALLEAARMLDTLVLVRQTDYTLEMEEYLSNIILYVDGNMSDLKPALIQKLRMVEVAYGEDTLSMQAALKEINPGLVVAIRMKLNPGASDDVYRLTNDGAEVIHLIADEYGREKADKPLFIKERMKQIHLSLVENGREGPSYPDGREGSPWQSIWQSRSSAAQMPDHRYPPSGGHGMQGMPTLQGGYFLSCGTRERGPGMGRKAYQNLMAGWHNQLLEILGAMGIREVRRLRGEMGRAMFFEDLEKEIFASMGTRG